MIFFLLLSSLSFGAEIFDGISELEGTWTQACARAYQREERIHASIAEFVETNYRDTQCGVPSIEMHSIGEIFLGDAIFQPNGAREIDFRFEKVLAILRSENYVRYFNEKKICGFTNWVLHEAKEVTGLDCSIFWPPPKGFWRYGIYRLAGNELFLGKLSPEHDASTPERRPRELDPSPYRKR